MATLSHQPFLLFLSFFLSFFLFFLFLFFLLLGHLGLFFWNEIDANSIHAVWRPKSFLPNKFSVVNASHKMPCDGMMILDVQAVIAEIISLGKGLIVDVEFR